MKFTVNQFVHLAGTLRLTAQTLLSGSAIRALKTNTARVARKLSQHSRTMLEQGRRLTLPA
jgi:hypothetical protein